jgi:hypothetical protein
MIQVTGANGIVSTVLTDSLGNYTASVYPPGTYTVSEVLQSGWSHSSLPPVGSWSVGVHAGQDFQNIDFGNCQQPCAGSPTASTLDISTGFNQATGVAMPTTAGQRDDDWVVIDDPFPTNALPYHTGGVCQTEFPNGAACPGQTTEPRPAYVIPKGATSWGGPIPVSEWIASNLTSQGTCNGCYQYQFCFCLDAGFQNAQLSGHLFADDEASVFLNNNHILTNPAICKFQTINECQFNTSSQAFFQEGLNCITVEVANTFKEVTGLDIKGTVTADQGLVTNRCCGPGCIFGTKWNDQDADGVKVSGEPELMNWTINLSGGSTTKPPVLTDRDGDYSFCGLLPGTYTVSESLQSGWVQTFPPNQTYTVNLQPGQQVQDINFGNHQPDPGKGTMIIKKIAVGGDATFYYTGTYSAFAITTIAGNGSKAFFNIPPGSYMVNEPLLPPLGWQFTSLVCTDPNGNTTVTGTTANIHLEAGETIICTYANALPTHTPTPTQSPTQTPTPTLRRCAGSEPMCTGLCPEEDQKCCLVGGGEVARCLCLSACPTSTPTRTPTPTPTCFEPISVIISTGRNVVPIGKDQIWSLIGYPTGYLGSRPATVILPNTAWTSLLDAQWISANAGCTNNCPAGTYSYQLCWDQCGPLANSPLLQILAADTATVFLDGPPALATSVPISFKIPETILGFTPGPGMHTLRVDVHNDGLATGMDLSGILSGSVRIVPCQNTPPTCVGDCNTDGAVTVDNLITMVNIALGNADVSICIAGDASGDGQITVDEILTAVNNALNGGPGCGAAGGP